MLNIIFMSYIIAFNPDQQQLLCEIDSYISLSNPVRVIVDKVVEQHPELLPEKVTKSTGRPAYKLATLIKLYIYGYLNSIKSSRKLEQESYRNLELLWLLGNLHQDYRTIADFRAKNKDSIHKLTLLLRKSLINNRYTCLAGNVKYIENELNFIPEIIVADGSYANEDQIEAIENK